MATDVADTSTKDILSRKKLWHQLSERERSDATGLSFEGEVSLTKQAFVESCDITVIMDRYKRAGIDLSSVMPASGNYDDYSDIPTYQEALNKMNDAHDMFMALPASIRKRFDHDAVEFIKFATDAKNVDEMIKLGLAIKRPEADKPVVEEKK